MMAKRDGGAGAEVGEGIGVGEGVGECVGIPEGVGVGVGVGVVGAGNVALVVVAGLSPSSPWSSSILTRVQAPPASVVVAVGRDQP